MHARITLVAVTDPSVPIIPGRNLTPTPPPPPRPPTKGVMTLPVLLTICGLVLAGFVVAWLVVLPNLRQPGVSAHEDVKVTNCRSSGGGYSATVLFHNPTDEPRDYEVKVSFTRPDGSEIDYALVAVDGVPAGGSVSADATTVFRNSDLRFGCAITKASRW